MDTKVIAGPRRAEGAAGVRDAFTGTDRRGFLRGVAAGGAAASAAGLPAPIARAAELSRESNGKSDDSSRINDAQKIRTDAAKLAAKRPQPDHPTNGEESLYPNRIANYSKALPHNRLGEVDKNAYKALLRAMNSGE